MLEDNTDPSELAFWKSRLVDHSLLRALKLHPEHATRIFGAVPVMRGNILQLGIILGAREILATPHGHLAFDINEIIEEKLRAALDELPEADKVMAQQFLSVKSQEAIARKLARKIIDDATGAESSP